MRWWATALVGCLFLARTGGTKNCSFTGTKLPVLLKLHKVGGTTIEKLMEDELCQDDFYDQKTKSRYGDCPNPFWHQTLRVYAKSGPKAFEHCTVVPHGLSLKPPVQLLTVLREPVPKFISAMFFFSQFERKERLYGMSDLKALTIPDLTDFAQAALHKRMKAPWQEYTCIFARTKKHFAFGEVATELVPAAINNLRRDNIVVGISDHMDSFAVRMWLSLGRPVDQARRRGHGAPSLPCFGSQNVNKKTHGHISPSNFTVEVIDQIKAWMVAEQQVFDAARAIAAEQEAKLGAKFQGALKNFTSRCRH